MMKKNALFFVIFFISIKVYSAISIYEFSDPILSERFQKLTTELRCPKCQNQNLADSNSTLSVDLKDVVYEKLKLGETDQQILDFMKQRYGEFILFDPEVNQSNLLLWFGPGLFILVFLIFFFKWYLNNREQFSSSSNSNQETRGL